MSESVLSAQGLTKRYGEKTAVADISFEVRPGEIVGLLGPNGAGKTTTISMVLGVLEPTAGDVVIEGISVAKDRSLALEHANFAAVYAPLPGNLTVAQNLRVFGLMYGVENLSERINVMIERFDLKKFRDVKCGLLSSGEQTRACLAKALINAPKLLLLDEPTASLDPSISRDIRAHIKDFARDGGGVLWTSHNMYEVQEVCDRVLFLSQGKILLEGDPKTLPAQHGKKTLDDLFVTLAREPLSLEEPA